jgi:GlcNAc-P-P-Und epimerase
MKTLIIGGSGFIGTKLIDQLHKQKHVVNIDKNDSDRFSHLTNIVDIRDKEALENSISSDTKCVILLAAEHRDDVSPASLYYDVNVEGTKNILNVLRKKNINKIIFTSSVAVYGLNKVSPCEDTKVDPFNHYGKSKWQAEDLLIKWQQEKPGERTVVIIRPTVVFGPGNRGNVYNLLSQIISGRFVMIGNGRNKKSMSYIDNICGFIEYCLDDKFKGNHVYNYVDKPDLSMNELVSLAERFLSKKLLPVRIPYSIGYLLGKCLDVFSKVTGKKLPISSIRVKKFCATTQFSSEKMLATGYVPPVKLEEGLFITMAAIRSSQKYVSQVLENSAPLLTVKKAV